MVKSSAGYCIPKEIITTELLERFWGKVSKTDSCWNWIRCCYKNGYGRFWVDGRVLEAHRVSWEIHYDTISPSLQVLHKCDNPKCINPDHLFLGTVKDNNADKVRKGRDHQTRKTHCPNGHAYTDENTWSRKSRRSRECRECSRIRHQKSQTTRPYGGGVCSEK